uniref:Pleckstrin homology domain-containing family H member 2-like n=1 Tax=Phallusia mammillata TaxID=59560 RepID=A0A6F9DPN9_9ASCI|nr:pleckstrin homology domain-containing family H member 2-like [Phallusia mammillata]
MESRDSPLTAMEWKKMYLQMEGKLKQFRIQATNIKLKLSQKMEELTVKCEQAEAKAEDAEYQLNLLRESLAGIPGAADQEERFCREKMAEMERACLEMQERNAVLEKELENEKYLRKLDKETLHEKAVRIKEWVSRALGTAEKEKKELQESNERLTTAVHAMQQRITELLESSSSPSAKRRSDPPSPDRYAVPTIRSGASGHVTPPPVADDALCSPGIKSWHTNPLFGDSASDDLPDESHTTTPLQSPSPLFMELDHCDPENPNPSNSSPSTESVAMETKPRAVSVKVAVDLSPGANSDIKKKSSTLPMTKTHVTSSPTSPPSSRSTPGSGHTHNIMGTFGSIRRRFKGLTDHHQRHRSHEETPLPSSRGREKREKQRSKSKSPAPRSNSSSRLRSSPTSVPGISTDSGANSPSLPAILQEEEDMVIDPPLPPQAPLFSSSLPANSSTWKGLHNNNRPPTPPLHHRLPSWESKIYDMTKTGFRIPTNVFGRTSSHKHSPNINFSSETGEFVHVVYKVQPLTVPVYTKIKGKATQIRPMPFTDASDSSDDDRTHRPIQRHLSPRHHHQRPSRSLTTSGEIVLSPTSAAIQQRKNGSPGLTRAFKRANSQQSMASSEGDYAIPPDAQFPCAASLAASDSSEPGHKLLKTSKHQSTSSIPRTSPTSPKPPACEAEVPATEFNGGPKCGYLTKLGGRVRTWKKRWFMMKNGTLYYYKSPNDLNRKPQGQIPLTGSSDVKVTQDENDCTFQLTCGKKTYYLTADSSNCARDWVKAVRGVLTSGHTVSSSDSGGDTCSVTGWLTRTSGGSSCHVWAVMRDGKLEFFENDGGDEMPIARLSLVGCTVEATRLNIQAMIGLGHARPHSPPPAPNHVIVVRPSSNREGNDVFLSFETEPEKANWLRALTSAARTSSHSALRKHDSFESTMGSDFERLLVKLVQADTKPGQGGAAEAVWRHPVLSYSKQGIGRALTSLSSDALRTEAIKISKSIQLFSNVSLDAASADYHVTLAQGIAQSCLAHVELRDELFAQLIKLTNRRESNDSWDPSLLQSWKLISLLLPLFLPRDKLLLVLRSHLQRHSKSKTEVGQYVVYCQRAMDRTSLLGERSAVPSRTEALPILLQNPYQHSRPFSVPVHFADGSYQVVSFDGSSTVSDFTRRVTILGELRHHTTSGFALCVDDPDSVTAEHYIEPSAKICDVISTWESQSRQSAVTNKGISPQPHDGAGEQVRATARFSFRRRLTFKAYRRTETEKEKMLLVYQIADDISRDRFPLSRDLAVEMTSLAAQVHFGDVSRAPQSDSFAYLIKRFLPARYRESASKHQLKQLRERISERWVALEGTSKSDAARIFLNTARKWPLCGAVLFLAKVETSGKHKGDTVWLAVSEDCLSVLNQKTMEVADKCEYADVVTFGGCKDFFMVVAEMAGVARKLFFALPKVQMFELVRLMADYMNASPSFGAKLRPRKASS